MKALLDTNILLRVRDRLEPEHQAVCSAVDRLLLGNFELCYCDQNIMELWAVLTRPRDANGYALGASEARKQIGDLGRTFTRLPDPRDIIDEWLNIVTTYEVLGRKAFDARLVAFMVASGIKHLVTLNAKDFARFPQITVVVPE